MDNVIKQGYLKRAKATPANRSSMATQILQMFEPQRWYVLGLRARRPYLEYYDKEEHVFSEQPINTYDLGRCQRLTYTLGRTNKNWTFCLFLQDRVIELTAESRPAMLDWCRVLERTLHNYGCLKKYDSEHVYSEYPIKHVPKKSEEVEDNVNPSVNRNTVAPLSLQLDGNNNGTGSTENTPVNSPGIDQEEIIFGTQFSLMEAINQESFTTSDNTADSELLEAAGFDGVVYRRKSSLKVDLGNNSEPDTSEDDFVTKDFWLDNKLPPVPKRNKAKGPPLPDRSLSLFMPQQEDTASLQSPTSDHMLINITPIKDRDRKSHSAPIVPSVFQTSIPPIPPRKNKENNNSNKGDNSNVSSIQENEENGQDFGGACGNSLGMTSHAKKPLVEELDDGYQSILECKAQPQGPKFFKSHQNVNVPEGSKSDSHDKPTNSNDLINGLSSSKWKSQNLQNTDQDGQREVTNYQNVPSHQNASNRAHQNATNLTQSKNVEENFYAPFPTSDDNNDKTVIGESTVVKDIVSGNSGKVSSESLSKSFSNVSDDCVTKIKIKDVSNLTTPPEVPPLETIPKVSSPSFSDDIICPPRKPVNHQNVESPKPPSLDSLPSRKLSPDHSLKSFPPLPQLPSLETLPKRVSPSDPQSPPIPPSRKTSNTNKLSSSVKANVTVIDVTSRPLPLLPTKDENTSPSLIVTNGRTSPSFDDFKFDTKTKKSNSLSSNSSSSDADTAGMAVSTDYEDATMRNKPPVIPPRLKTSIDRRSQSVYIPSSKEDVSNNLSSQEEKVSRAPGVIRQASLQDRQRINRSSGAFTVVPLKHSQAELLKEEQALHGVGITIHCKSGPRVALVDCFQGVWIAGYDFKLCPRLADKLHIGDELIKINNTRIASSSQAYKLMKHEKTDLFEFVVRRIPYGKVIAMRRGQEREPLGIHREGGTAVITYVDPSGLAAQGGLEKKAKSVQEVGTPGATCNWMLTEINNRPLNLTFKGNEIEHLLNAVGRDISVVVQPEDFVKSLKKQLKKLKNYKDYLAPT